jgi:hypothetical protein
MIEVAIKLKKHEVLPDVFDWLRENELEYLKHWTWDSPKLGTQWANENYTHIFKFFREENATFFMLRWS